MINNRSDDPLAGRCGHNFPVTECPYKHCVSRDLAIAAVRELITSSDLTDGTTAIK